MKKRFSQRSQLLLVLAIIVLLVLVSTRERMSGSAVVKVPVDDEDIIGAPAAERVSSPELSEPVRIFEKPVEQSTQLPQELVNALRKYAVKENNLPPQLQALLQGVENK